MMSQSTAKESVICMKGPKKVNLEQMKKHWKGLGLLKPSSGNVSAGWAEKDKKGRSRQGGELQIVAAPRHEVPSRFGDFEGKSSAFCCE